MANAPQHSLQSKGRRDTHIYNGDYHDGDSWRRCPSCSTERSLSVWPGLRDISTWSGLWLRPARRIVEKINAAAAKTAADPDIGAKLGRFGSSPVSTSRGEFDR